MNTSIITSARNILSKIITGISFIFIYLMISACSSSKNEHISEPEPTHPVEYIEQQPASNIQASTLTHTSNVGVEYYVDASLINDCNATYSIQNRDCSGSDGSAFNTIQEGVTVLQPGDKLIIRGGVYREHVTLSKTGTSIVNKIRITSYKNEVAEINAAEIVSDWQRCRNLVDCQGNPNWENVYFTNPGFEVKQLFQNSKKLKPSRYPNTGWRYPTQVGINQQQDFTDSLLEKPRGYFNEAIANVKTTPFWISNIPVNQSYADGRILLENEISDFKGSISTEYGYYLTNIVEEINEQGKWAYDELSGRLYLWPNGDLTAIEASKRDYGISIQNTMYHEISGVTIKYPNVYGVWVHGSDYNRIENTKIYYSYAFGIYVQGGFSTRGVANNNFINNNSIKFANYRGISNDGYSDNILITKNFVYATGVINFGEDLNNGTGEGIFVEGDNIKVLNNIIDRTGYTGIYLSGSERTNKEIAYNIVNNSNLALTDGGGIYAGGKSNSFAYDEIHHNIVQNIYGYVGGIKKYTQCDSITDIRVCASGSSGIYIDEQGNNFNVRANTVMNSNDAGIFYHWTKNNNTENNVLYNNRKQIWISGKNEPRFTLEGNIFSKNVLYATKPDQLTFFLGINYDDFNFGVSNNNYLYNPYEQKNIRSQRYVNRDGELQVLDERLSFEEWQGLSGKEQFSKPISGVYATDNTDNSQIKDSLLMVNYSTEAKTYTLDANYCGLDGELVSSSINIDAFSAKVLLKCFCNNDFICNNNENISNCPSDCAAKDFLN